LSGDYAEALAAVNKVKPLFSAAAQIQRLDYLYYAALTAAALYEDASADEQKEWRELLTAHREQLREWGENCSSTFADKYALVAAEIARLEGRDADAMRLYEEAIRSARENGFVQNEGTAHEVAARFYAARGAESIAHSCLRNARYCYLRWGAHGKVRQLDERYPHLREETPAGSGAVTIGAPVAQLDVDTAIKASQAVSGEIVLENLIKTLMVIAVEHAGAERGLLILPRGDQLWVEAEAATGRKTVEVSLRQALVAPSELPLSILQYVVRTKEPVISDDASQEKPFSADEYVASRRVRSVLCLPLIKQAKLVGVLYLENNMAASVFTPARIALLKLLASQAAVSLENTRLYSDLQEREAKVRRLVDSNIIGIYIWDFQGRIIDANDAFLDIVGYSREDLISGRLHYPELTPPEWNDVSEQARAVVKTTGTAKVFEKEYLRKDGSRVPILLAGATFGEGQDQGVAFVLDLTERKRAEENLRESEQRFREAQAELAHVNRVTAMGQLTASIAHEVNQPIAAAVINAEAALRFLGRDPPDLEEVRQGLDSIVKDANRAGEVISRIRELIKKTPQRKDWVDINDAITDVVALTRSEMVSNGVSLHTRFAPGMAPSHGDRVQLQQVILNLIVNAIEAMSGMSAGARELWISTEIDGSNGALVAVRDSGPGLDPASLERLFDAFYTTKTSGMGMGLSICRSIIEAHGGRIWAEANTPQGATFQFTLPSQAAS
jgi:PAS domain S-box-containing protein